MPTNKEYKFKTVEEIMKFVNSKNVNDFIIDFAQMLIGAVSFKEAALDKVKELIDKIPQDERDEGLYQLWEDCQNQCNSVEFTWIDDGKHDYTNKSKIEISIESQVLGGENVTLEV